MRGSSSPHHEETKELAEEAFHIQQELGGAFASNMTRALRKTTMEENEKAGRRESRSGGSSGSNKAKKGMSMSFSLGLSPTDPPSALPTPSPACAIDVSFL